MGRSVPSPYMRCIRPPPSLFLRKNVKVKGLFLQTVQEFHFKGVAGGGVRLARKSKSPVGLSSNWPRDFRWTEVASVNQSGRYGRSSARIFWTSLHRTLRLDWSISTRI